MTRPAFSWKKAALHAGPPILLCFLAMGYYGAQAANPYKAGQAAGRAVLFVSVGAIGLSWLFQTGRRVAALIVLVAAVGLGALAVILGVSSPVREHAITRAERAPLVEVERDGVRWLQHPVFGFSVRHPGPAFTEASALASKMGSGPDTAAWAYVDINAGSMLVIVVTKGTGTRAEFEGFFRGVKEGFMNGLRTLGDADVKTLEDEIRWDLRTARVHLEVGGATHVRLNGRSGKLGSAREAAVAVIAFTSEGDGLADVVLSVRTE